MILRSLELRHFGKFSERNVDFRRGMNLVIGPNEVGKSTLVEAIPAVLFGVRNKDRFRTWGRQGVCEAALVLEGRNHTVRVERDIASDRVSLVERDDLYHTLNQFEGKASPQGRSSERSEYLEQLTRLFGVADEDIFRASLFFGQGSLEVSGQGGMTAKIKTLLSGFVEVDYDRVLQSLQDDYFSITRENPWGKDKTRERELEEIRARLTQLESRWHAEQGSLHDLEAMRKEMADLGSAIETGRGDFEKGERYLAWVRQQWELEEKAERLRKEFSRIDQEMTKVNDLIQRRAAIEKELQAAGLPRNLPEKLPRLLSESEDVRQELVQIQSEMVALREKLVSVPAPDWKKRLGISLVVAAAAGAAAWSLPQWLVWSVGAGVAALAGLWGLYFANLFGFRTDLSHLQGQQTVLEEQRVQAQSRLATLDGEFEELGLKTSSVERVRMQRNLERHREFADALRESESGLKVLPPVAALTEEKERLTRELAVIEERLEQERHKYRQALLPREELAQAERKLHDLGDDLRARETRLLELTRREASLQGELADLERIEEEGERLRERERVLVRRKAGLAAGFELLSQAVGEFRQTYFDRFAADIGHYLAVVSGGCYGEICLEDDLRILLKSRNGQWKPVEHFSRGTADAVYFAVRLALTRHLSRGRRLPLILDDPLVNLDSTRLAETLGILEKISRDHQVILLAHDERLLKRAARERWNVVLLEQLKNPQTVETPEKKEDVQQLFLL